MNSYKVWLKDFFDNYGTNEDYKELCRDNSASKINVLGRKKYFDDEIEKLCK